jgi:mitochondrial fission protein ELM1
LKTVNDILLLAQQKSAKLLITTSRRTPMYVEKKLEHLNKNSIVKELVLFNHEPKKVMKQFLSEAEKIFCTEDSGSMITEAVLSKKPVYTLHPQNYNPKGIIKIFIQNLIDKEYICATYIDDILDLTMEEQFNEIEVKPSVIVYQKISELLKEKK